MSKSTIDIPWYKPEDFDKLRRLFVNHDILHDTYDQWLAATEVFEKKSK